MTGLTDSPRLFKDSCFSPEILISCCSHPCPAWRCPKQSSTENQILILPHTYTVQVHGLPLGLQT